VGLKRRGVGVEAVGVSWGVGMYVNILTDQSSLVLVAVVV
jgi:hypothetical protein